MSNNQLAITVYLGSDEIFFVIRVFSAAEESLDGWTFHQSPMKLEIGRVYGPFPYDSVGCLVWAQQVHNAIGNKTNDFAGE